MNSDVRLVVGVHPRLRSMPRISVKHVIRRRSGFRRRVIMASLIYLLVYRLSIIWIPITILVVGVAMGVGTS